MSTTINEEPEVERLPARSGLESLSDAPEDWDSTPLAALLRFQNGVNAEKKAYGYGIPFANVLEVITHSHLKAADIPGRVSLPAELVARYQLRRGDVLFNRTSETQDELGLSSVYSEDSLAVFGGFVIRGRATTGRLDPEYAGYALRSYPVRKQIVAKGQGAIRANIGQIDLKQVVIALPLQCEQQLIASALSAVESQIGALDELIAKKRMIKLAAMQQLLTARIRLKGFCAPWRETELGNVMISCSSGATPRRDHPEFFKGTVRWITSGELNYNVITETKETISEEAVRRTSLRLIPPGTFLMAITGMEAEGTRGACAMVGKAATTNQSCMAVFPTSDLCSEYLFHYYVLNGKPLALRFCQGTKQQSYTAGIVKKLPITIPTDIGEQRAIARVLSDMDGDIASSERWRDKVTEVKQGMMQQLLTGRIRLMQPETVA